MERLDKIVLNQQEIAALNRIKRLNLVNSLSGIKPGNLLGTISKHYGENLALISSVVHLGSNPALLGFIMRPSEDVPRQSLLNIEETGHFTLNHIPIGMEQNAHYTSAKFEHGVSEFKACNISAEYVSDFQAPFVKQSPIKIGLKLKEIIPISCNNTKLVCGEIEKVIIANDKWLSPEGFIDLEQTKSLGIGGLNHYYTLQKQNAFPYARLNDLPEFKAF